MASCVLTCCASLCRTGDARIYMLELAWRRLAWKPMHSSSRLEDFFFVLTLAFLFITLDMHQWTWLSWLGIILQRNNSVCGSLWVTKTHLSIICQRLDALSRPITIHQTGLKCLLGLFKPPPHISPVHTHLELLFFHVQL